MSRLFVELYLDEDVHRLLATLLRNRGITVRTTVEAGNRNASDDDQLAYAVANEMAILTHNRHHFENLARAYYENKRKHYGIIIAVQRPVHELGASRG